MYPAVQFNASNLSSTDQSINPSAMFTGFVHGMPAPGYPHGMPATGFAHGMPAPGLSHGMPSPGLAYGMPAPGLAHGMSVPGFARGKPAFKFTLGKGGKIKAGKFTRGRPTQFGSNSRNLHVLPTVDSVNTAVVSKASATSSSSATSIPEKTLPEKHKTKPPRKISNTDRELDEISDSPLLSDTEVCEEDWENISDVSFEEVDNASGTGGEFSVGYRTTSVRYIKSFKTKGFFKVKYCVLSEERKYVSCFKGQEELLEVCSETDEVPSQECYDRNEIDQSDNVTTDEKSEENGSEMLEGSTESNSSSKVENCLSEKSVTESCKKSNDSGFENNEDKTSVGVEDETSEKVEDSASKSAEIGVSRNIDVAKGVSKDSESLRESEALIEGKSPKKNAVVEKENNDVGEMDSVVIKEEILCITIDDEDESCAKNKDEEQTDKADGTNKKIELVNFGSECHQGETRIHKDICDSTKPLLGLEYIIELWEDIDVTLSGYSCWLCEQELTGDTVLDHIDSVAHKVKYLKTHFPSRSKSFANTHCAETLGDDKVTELDSICKAIADCNGRLLPFIISESFLNKKKKIFYEAVENAHHFNEENTLAVKASHTDNMPSRTTLKQGDEIKSLENKEDDSDDSDDDEEISYLRLQKAFSKVKPQPVVKKAVPPAEQKLNVCADKPQKVNVEKVQKVNASVEKGQKVNVSVEKESKMDEIIKEADNDDDDDDNSEEEDTYQLLRNAFDKGKKKVAPKQPSSKSIQKPPVSMKPDAAKQPSSKLIQKPPVSMKPDAAKQPTTNQTASKLPVPRKPAAKIPGSKQPVAKQTALKQVSPNKIHRPLCHKSIGLKLHVKKTEAQKVSGDKNLGKDSVSKNKSNTSAVARADKLVGAVENYKSIKHAKHHRLEEAVPRKRSIDSEQLLHSKAPLHQQSNDGYRKKRRSISPLHEIRVRSGRFRKQNVERDFVEVSSRGILCRSERRGNERSFRGSLPHSPSPIRVPFELPGRRPRFQSRSPSPGPYSQGSFSHERTLQGDTMHSRNSPLSFLQRSYEQEAKRIAVRHRSRSSSRPRHGLPPFRQRRSRSLSPRRRSRSNSRKRSRSRSPRRRSRSISLEKGRRRSRSISPEKGRRRRARRDQESPPSRGRSPNREAYRQKKKKRDSYSPKRRSRSVSRERAIPVKLQTMPPFNQGLVPYAPPRPPMNMPRHGLPNWGPMHQPNMIPSMNPVRFPPSFNNMPPFPHPGNPVGAPPFIPPPGLNPVPGAPNILYNPPPVSAPYQMFNPPAPVPGAHFNTLSIPRQRMNINITPPSVENFLKVLDKEPKTPQQQNKKVFDDMQSKLTKIFGTTSSSQSIATRQTVTIPGLDIGAQRSGSTERQMLDANAEVAIAKAVQQIKNSLGDSLLNADEILRSAILGMVKKQLGTEDIPTSLSHQQSRDDSPKRKPVLVPPSDAKVRFKEIPKQSSTRSIFPIQRSSSSVEQKRPQSFDDEKRSQSFGDDKRLQSFGDEKRSQSFADEKRSLNYVGIKRPSSYADEKKSLSFTDEKRPLSYADLKRPLGFTDEKRPLNFAEEKRPLGFADDKRSMSYGDQKRPMSYGDQKRPMSYDLKRPLSYADQKHSLAQRLASVLVKLGMVDVSAKLLAEMLRIIGGFTPSLPLQDITEAQIITILKQRGYLDNKLL